MKEREMVVWLDPVEESLIGREAAANGISKEEQLRRIISSALAEVARTKMDPTDIKKH